MIKQKVYCYFLKIGLSYEMLITRLAEFLLKKKCIESLCDMSLAPPNKR